jgi:hypothetical protein
MELWSGGGKVLMVRRRRHHLMHDERKGQERTEDGVDGNVKERWFDNFLSNST